MACQNIINERQKDTTQGVIARWQETNCLNHMQLNLTLKGLPSYAMECEGLPCTNISVASSIGLTYIFEVNTLDANNKANTVFSENK